ncbi:MAG: stage III sporulation protein AE [Clostridiales bacterium]|jgi:stage III sporulation protein AE|nr:stage III sporulation protein AE [Clostridiales bacterium]
MNDKNRNRAKRYRSFQLSTSNFQLIILFLIALAVFFCFFSSSDVFAASDEKGREEVEKELESNIDERLGGLDLSELERFVNSLDDGIVKGNLKDYIDKIVKGEYGSGGQAVFKIASELLLADALNLLPMLAAIVIVCLLSGFVSGVTSNFLKKSTQEIIFFVCYALIILILMSRVIGYIETVRTLLQTMTRLMDILFPVLLTLITALGGAVSVSAYQPLMAVLAVTIVSVISGIIVPCFIAAILFSLVGNMSETVKLEGFRSFFKTAANWLLGGMFGLFTLFVSVEGITGAALDNVTVSAVKFAVSSYVPILGGYLSDGFDLVLGSVVLIKNALGFTGIMIMLSVILAPVIKMAVFILVLKLTAAIAEPISDKRISKMISSLASNMKLLITSVLGVGFMFFLTVMLVIMTGNVI